MLKLAAVAVLLFAPLGGYLYVWAANAEPAGLTAEAVPQPACAVPMPPAREKFVSADYERFDRALAAYRRCVEDYVQARQVEVKRHNQLALANADAANLAAQRLTDYMRRLGGPAGQER